MVSTSAYDGVGRRITKVVSNSGDLDMTYHFYYEGQSIIELRNGSDLVLKQHVWANLAGGYVDELIENDVNADPTDGSEQDCELRAWACQDANYNVIGFVDDDLAVLERYEYTPYGQRTVFYSAGSNDPLAHTPTLIPRRVELGGTSGGYGAYAIGHQGLYHDEETDETLVYNRARMLHARLGRFTQRDPLGYVDGIVLYLYLSNNPLTSLDPKGTQVAPGPGGIITLPLPIPGLPGGKVMAPLPPGFAPPKEWEVWSDTFYPLGASKNTDTPDCPEVFNGNKIGWNKQLVYHKSKRQKLVHSEYGKLSAEELYDVYAEEVIKYVKCSCNPFAGTWEYDEIYAINNGETLVGQRRIVYRTRLPIVDGDEYPPGVI